VKEFLASQKIDYHGVNVLTDPNAERDLKKLGANSIPVVARGDEFVFAQSLDDVAAFLGLDVKFNRLPPPVLMDRWFYFLETSLSLIGSIPLSKLEHQPIATRKRSLSDLSFHIFQVPEAFLENIQNGIPNLDVIFEKPRPAHVESSDEIIAHGKSMIDRLRAWWAATEDKKVAWSTSTFYGVQPVHNLLERSTWHTAQHVRQLQAALDDLKVSLSQRIKPAAYAGLPMPEVVWE
jgi:hypothetical protein